MADREDDDYPDKISITGLNSGRMDFNDRGYLSRRNPLDETISTSDELSIPERDFKNFEGSVEKRALAQKLIEIERLLVSLIKDKNSAIRRIRPTIELQKQVSFSEFDKLCLRVKNAITLVLNRLQEKGADPHQHSYIALPWPDSQRPTEIKNLTLLADKVHRALTSFRMDPNNTQSVSGITSKFVDIETNARGLIAELKNLDDVWKEALK